MTQYLRSKFILTAYDADRIGQKDLQTEAGRLLLDILIKKSDSAFMQLVDALNSQSVNQPHLANLLYIKSKSEQVTKSMTNINTGSYKNDDFLMNLLRLYAIHKPDINVRVCVCVSVCASSDSVCVCIHVCVCVDLGT